MELLLRVLVAAGTTIFVPPAVAPVEVVVAGAVHRVAVPRWLEAFDVAAAVRSLCETHALASADCATLEAEVERRRAERWAASGYGGPPSAAWVDAWKEAQRRLDRGDARNATALWSELLRGRRGAPFAEAASPSAFWAEREARATVQLGFLSRVWANGLPALTEMPGGVERHVWSLATSGSSLLTSAHKLRHDALQLEHLLEHGRLPRSERFRAALERLWATFNIASTGFGEESIHNFFVLNPPSMSAIGELHQTLYHVPLSPRLEPSALNLELDWDAIERQYLGETPHIAVIDGMLTPPALSAVRDFTLEGPLFIAFVSSFLLFAHIVLFAHPPLNFARSDCLLRREAGILGGVYEGGVSFAAPLANRGGAQDDAPERLGRDALDQDVGVQVRQRARERHSDPHGPRRGEFEHVGHAGRCEPRPRNGGHRCMAEPARGRQRVSQLVGRRGRCGSRAASRRGVCKQSARAVPPEPVCVLRLQPVPCHGRLQIQAGIQEPTDQPRALRAAAAPSPRPHPASLSFSLSLFSTLRRHQTFLFV